MRRLLFAAVCAALSAVAAPDAADIGPAVRETPSAADIATLPAVIVEASRIDQAADALPARVEVYDATAIAASGAHNIADFLEREAHLTVRSVNANPTQSQIALRGYGENSFGRCKVLLDGEALNTVDMQPPNLLRIPLERVARIEILHGPQTVLHGDGSNAGVVNVITEAAGEPKTRVAVEGGSDGRVGVSVRRTGGGADADAAARKDLTYWAGYDFLRSDGWRDNAAWQTHGLAAGLRQAFDDGSYVRFGANYNWTEYQMPGALDETQYRTDPRQSTHDDDWTSAHAYGINLDAKAMLADETYLKTDLGYAQKNRRTKWGDYGYADEYALYATRFDPRLVHEAALGRHANKATVGLDTSWDHYDIRNGGTGRAENPFFDRFRVAPFAHDDFHLTEDLSLVGGVRIEELWNAWHRDETVACPRQNDFAWAYELGLVFRPSDDVKAYLRQTRFYRAPFCDEMNYVAPGETLVPESGYSLDAGVACAFAAQWRAFLDGYATWTEDEIFYNPYHTPTVWGWSGYNANAPSDTWRLGFDAGVGWKREKVAEAALKCGFVDARFLHGDYAHNEVPLVPRTRVRAEAGHWLGDELALRGGCTFADRQRFGGDYRNEAGSLAGYVLFDAGVTYEPERWGLKGLKLSIGVDNLFDRRHCDYAGYSAYSGRYYYPASGRSWRVALAYAF